MIRTRALRLDSSPFAFPEKNMRQLLMTALAVAVASTSVSAQDWAKDRLEKSPRHREWVKVNHDKREVSSFVVYPEVKDKATAVVVIHEIFGLSDWACNLADELAETGYIAIAPDLLSGMGPKGGGTKELGREVGTVIRDLPADQITADLNACVDYMAKLPACNGKVVVCGFCWGGGQTFRFATNNKSIKAAFPFYGTGPNKVADCSRIVCPVYGFYAGDDARINTTVTTTAEAMEEAHKKFEYKMYDGAGHGFMRAGEDPTSKDTHKEANIKARKEAWERWKELLKKV
jgi:carboxymethylenebutenolidase